MEKILKEGIQCPDEGMARISGFMLEGDSWKWWKVEKTRRRHTWDQFKVVFTTEYCPLAYREARRREFEELQQGNMTVSEYERKFRELSEFCMHMIPDDHTKKVRFIDGLNENIALTLTGSVHPTYQSARDAALELERQVEMHKPSRRRSFEGGAPSQGASRKSHSSAHRVVVDRAHETDFSGEAVICGQPNHIRRECPYGSGSVLGAGRRAQHISEFQG
ncbi:uncharacterized protein LOC132804029 [Ziziphus jujuba]|uniref:Uncharacterized protein LOC132804029 n=1 Tax=Ziziphus jujuba TaxID=326968 RepID=A0ABM4AAY6_ZIZJJ|nr:uncharacterized protein LOC132804029 [Ziziphus jujuba]